METRDNLNLETRDNLNLNLETASVGRELKSVPALKLGEAACLSPNAWLEH
jgi:hypothetical protein